MAKVLTLNVIGNSIEQDFNTVGNAVLITIDFGTTPINERIFNIVNPLCTTVSNIEISQIFKTQSEENFGVTLELFTECLNGSFNITAVSTEPFSRGVFNLKYFIL